MIYTAKGFSVVNEANIFLEFFCFFSMIQRMLAKAREFQKIIYFCFIDYAKAFDSVDHNKLENS